VANAILFKVEFVTKHFDLTDPQSAFEFIFRVYNFLSVAKADNDNLERPKHRLLPAKESVAQKNYQSFTSAKRKHEEDQKTPAKKSKPTPGTSARGEGGDGFDNPSVQREVTRAGYTLTQPISEELTLLTPVSRN
jgi:hypothetical protein